MDIYKKNLNLLSKKNKSLASKIVNNDFDTINDFEIINSDKISLKIKVNNKSKLVHSKYRPVVQAKKKIDTLEFESHNLIGIAGIACGYYVEEILKIDESGSRFIIFENRLDILKEVMESRDLEEIFTNKNVFIIDGTDKNYINLLKIIFSRIDFVALAMGNIQFFKTPVLKEKEKKYQEFQERFFSTLNFLSKTFGNSSEDTLIGVDNILKNIDIVFKSKNFKRISKFRNKPAILVAAGPSLDKNIDLLKKYQDKVLIIACDTVFEKLIEKDIIPDIVTSLERSERSYDYFYKELYKNNNIPKKVTLMALGVVDPRIFDFFPGEKVTLFRQTVPTEKWFSKNIDNINSIEVGSSVANMNFSIARELGASPIILVGQDLAYSKEGKSHTGETGYEKNNDNRDLNTKEQKDLVEVEGYNGEKLISRKWWKIFKQWFEMKIVKYNVHCIDATEGGAYIKGTEIMSLEEVALKYFDTHKPNFYSELKNLKSKNTNIKFDEFISSYQKLTDEINEVKDEMVKIREKIPELHSQIKFDENLKGLMHKFNEIDLELNQLYFKNRFIYFILQPVFLNMKKLKIKIDNNEVSTVERFKKLYGNHYRKLIQSEKIINKTLEILKHHLQVLENKNR